jgi:hypothetical protein
LRYANGNAGNSGKFSMWLDEKLLASNVTFSSTGKWETFGAVNIKNLPMTQGRRILKFSFDDGGMNVGKAQFTRTAPLPQALPTAKAGGNVSYPSSADSAQCDGSKSTSGSLGYIKYQWSQVYGPSKLLIKNATAPKPTFKNIQKGVYKVRLTVSDSVNSDYNEAFIFVQDGGNIAPEITINNPISGATLIENQWILVQASAEDLDGSIKQVKFMINGDSVSIDTTAPYEYRMQVGIGNYSAQAQATDNSGKITTSSSISFSALSLAGNWVLEPVAKSLAVGPTVANLTWWSNSFADVATRSCLFDDVYQISKNGEFKNALGSQTWLEGWQNAGKELCGVPVSPHDGTSIGKWYIDSITGLLVIDGKGNYLGLPKATNSGELSNGSTVPNQRNYQISLTATRLTAVINYGAGYWQFQFIRGGAVNNHVISNERMLIYPNPASSQIQVLTKEVIVEVKIFNELGSLVLQGTNATLNVSNLSDGLYFVEVTTNTQKQVTRWIKQ